MRVAVERGADAVLVHHGWMWRNEDRRVIGTRRTRMALALNNDLNLYAYHLPLDAHPQLGNNASWRACCLAPSCDGAPRTCGPDNVWLGDAPAWPRWATPRARARTPGREPLLWAIRASRWVAWPGAPAARGACGTRWTPAPPPTSRARSPNPPCTWRARPVGFIGAGHRHRERRPGAGRPWPNASASRSSSWIIDNPVRPLDAAAPGREDVGRKTPRKGRFSSGHVWVPLARATQGSCSFLQQIADFTQQGHVFRRGGRGRHFGLGARLVDGLTIQKITNASNTKLMMMVTKCPRRRWRRPW